MRVAKVPSTIYVVVDDILTTKFSSWVLTDDRTPMNRSPLLVIALLLIALSSA